MGRNKKLRMFFALTVFLFFAVWPAVRVESREMPVYNADENNIQDNQMCSGEQSVLVTDWKRRIYQVTCEITAGGNQTGSVRVYAGKHFHMVDSQGNILSEGTYLDEDGNIAADRTGGQICRDINGWYVLWEDADLENFKEHQIYVQADSDFVGGNNQIIGIEGLAGIYYGGSTSPAIPFNTVSVNVAVEVEALDMTLPVMRGMDLSDGTLSEKAVVKLNCIYGELSDIPLKAQWYAVEDGGENPVGDTLTKIPYSLPDEEILKLSEEKEYMLRLYYAGEASTEESRINSNGYETVVSDTEPMAQAFLRNEVVDGCIQFEVHLEQSPYKDDSNFHVFKFKLYRFDGPNQSISDGTPFTEYSAAFETGGDDTVKAVQIGGLTAGWYTLVPETPEAYYVEKVDDRTDNCWPNFREGASAGVDFHIGEIVDNQYSWEVMRYQGQDMKDPLGDNFFKVSYKYRETVYPVIYKANLPEGAVLDGQEPTTPEKYPTGAMVTVKGSNGMTSKGWKFAGWSVHEGDGVYKSGEKLYSDSSVNSISVEGQTAMPDGGLTLYGRWIPVYTVDYNGNTNTGGNPPTDDSGTVSPGMNIFYSGDEIVVREAGNLEKTDSDGTRYVFDGWCLSQDGSGTRYRAGDRVKIESSDLTFYAQWKTENQDKYAVNYIAVLPEGRVMTGMLPVDKEKYDEGSIVTVKDQGTIALEHYRFAGWSLKSREDGIYQNGEEIYGTKNIGKTVTKTEAVMKENGLYFYSRWIPLYRVIYNANAGSVEGLPEDPTEYEVNQITKIMSGEQMKRNGYQFMEWNTKRDGSGQSYDSGLTFNMPGEDLILYAQWKKIPVPETQDETFERPEPGNGGIWPLAVLAVIGVACIIAYVVYQWLSHRKG